MRRLDSYLSGLLNFLLFPFFDLFIKLRQISGGTKDIRRICFIKLLGFGSIINALPLIRQTRLKYPNAELLFISFEENREICKMIKDIDTFFLLRNRDLITLIIDMIHLLLWSIGKKIDVSLNLEFLSNSSLFISFWILSTRRVGYYEGGWLRSIILTDCVYYNPFKHIRLIFLALGQPLGIVPSIEKCQLAEEYLDIPAGPLHLPISRTLLDDKNIVLINPNAGQLTLNRRWPPDHFSRLIELITASNSNVAIKLIGSKEDFEYTQGILNDLGEKIRDRCENICGMLTLAQLALLLKNHTRFFVTNDSGPFHLALLYRVPTIVFFGPETSRLYGPLAEEPWVKVFEKDLYCVPCLNVFTKKYTNCKNNECLRQITVKEVFDSAQEIFEA